MKNKDEAARNDNVALEKIKDTKVEPAPAFVAADEMLEKLKTLTREITDRAFDFFRERGGGFGKELDDWFRAEREMLRPMPVEIRESKDNFFVSAAVPGFKPEEIEVSVKDNIVIINGIAEAIVKEDETNTIVREWNSNRFCRQLTLPAAVTADKVTAKLTNGMLELTLPKEAARDATKIAVASA